MPRSTFVERIIANDFDTESIESAPESTADERMGHPVPNSRELQSAITAAHSNSSQLDNHHLPQPSPPSFSNSVHSEQPTSAPIQSTMDTVIDGSDEALARQIERDERESIEKSDEDQEKLAMLLTCAEDDEEAKDIVDKFHSPRGRELLFNGNPNEETEEQLSNRTRRRSGRGRTSRNELAELIGSDEESRAIAESIRTNRDETDGVTTRRGTVLGCKRKIEGPQSVPLNRKSLKHTIADRSNFVERNRMAAYDRAINDSRSVEKSTPRRRSKRIVKQSDRDNRRKDRRARETPERSVGRSSRRSGRIRRNAPSSDEEEELIEEEVIDGDGESELSDTSMHSSGSGGRQDDEKPESEDDKSDYSFDISQGGASDRYDESEAEDDEEEDDDNEESEEEREMVDKVRIGSRRSSRIQRKVHSVLQPQPAPMSKKTKPAKKKKKKQKKRKMRRTNPNSVFNVEETSQFLTEQERKERLEALVRQSEDVAQKLNEAMAAEKQRNEEAAKERADAVVGEASPGRKLRKYEGDVVWPTAEGMKMQPHQEEGVRWMITLDSRGLNAILADEMGLGKTIQSIAFLATVCLGENRGPHLIIAPKNVVPHWAAEFENFYPGKFKVLTHIGAGSERFERLQENLRKFPDFDVLVTSYDLAQRDLLQKVKSENQTAWANRRIIREMQKLEFEYAVVDEAHRLKNAESKFSMNLRKYTQAKRRLLLTGTPLSNNLQELWALMNVLNPRIFGNHVAFNEWFAAPFDTTRGGLTVGEQSLIVSRLHTILRPFFRRRLRADVCPSYSSADEVIIKCPQSALQQAMVRHYLKCRKNKELSASNTFMILRHIANHPYVHCGALFDERELRVPKILVGASGKFLFLYYALPRLISGGHRVLIFSQFKKVLNFLEDLMEMLGFKFGRLDGDSDNEDRDSIVSRFNADGSDISIFLLTTRAGGVGLNLQTADTVILFDSDWNPSADLQAVSRIQRIGQKRVVHIMRLVTENSIDEAVVDRGREKLRTEAVAVGAGNFNTNVDPTEKPEVRQKELEAILSKYEKNEHATEDFLNIAEENAGNTVSNDAVTKTKHAEWGAQLLRKDEKSLPENPKATEVVELNPRTVPEWLQTGKNMKAASLALKCMYKYQIPEALEKGELHEKAKNGQLPAKRARRQRFDFGSMTTEGGSDTEEYHTPNPDTIVESESEDFTPEVDDDGKPVVVNVDALCETSKPIAVYTSPNGRSAVPILPSPNGAHRNGTATHPGAGSAAENGISNYAPIAPNPFTFMSRLGVIAPNTVTTVKRTNYVPPPPKRKTMPPVTEPVSDKSLSPQDVQERRKSTATCERERTLEISERAVFKHVQPQLTPTAPARESGMKKSGGGSSSMRGLCRLGASSVGSGRKSSGNSSKKTLVKESNSNSGSSRKSLGSLARRNSGQNAIGNGRSLSLGNSANEGRSALGSNSNGTRKNGARGGLGTTSIGSRSNGGRSGLASTNNGSRNNGSRSGLGSTSIGSRSNGGRSGLGTNSNGSRNINTAVKPAKSRVMEVIVIEDSD